MFYRTIFLSLLAVGCTTGSSLTVYKEKIDKDSYAANFAKTPDPNLESKGEKLYVSYSLPKGARPQDNQIALQVVYKDMTEKTIIFPLEKRSGTVSYLLSGDEFSSAKGIFTYKAELMSHDKGVLDSVEQRLFVNLIKD